MNVPDDRRYQETHEWFQADGDIVTVGITQFAAEELTDITFVDLPVVGTKVEAGGEAGEIESVKATSELFSAVGGEIIEVNGSLVDAPELVNNEPYSGGWMIRIKAADLSPLEKLMNADAYISHCGD